MTSDTSTESKSASTAIPSIAVGDILATGIPCPNDGYWQVVEKPDACFPFPKGYPMPRYGGRKVEWRLLRLE